MLAILTHVLGWCRRVSTSRTWLISLIGAGADHREESTHPAQIQKFKLLEHVFLVKLEIEKCSDI